ncbi:MAG: carboxypeptidase-like regulatory domain-containing protein [Acidobacteriota bacterium]
MRSLFIGLCSLVLAVGGGIHVLRATAYGQVGIATLEGTVSDEDGAAVAGAYVAVAQVGLSSTQLLQGLSSSITTGQGGSYSFQLLPAGLYTVQAEAPGFEPAARKNITVSPGESARADFKLKKKKQNLPGFDSPYLGHDGFRHIPIFLEQPGTELSVLDMEQAIGERWTFVAVIWPLFEPAGPTDAANDPMGAWAKLDMWVSACRERGLNLMVQPVFSGNGVAPPPWVLYRTPTGYNEAQQWTNPDGTTGSSPEGVFPGAPRAPVDMQSAVNFFVKLVQRYKPGGQLATERGWSEGYGVRAWEIENEPDGYGLWTAEWDDYTELLVRVYQAIKSEDPLAVIVAPASGANGNLEFLRAILDKRMQRASLEYKLSGAQYAAGPFVDAVSFHVYEALDGSRIEDVFHRHKAWWDLYAAQEGFTYDPNRPFWHTEGNLNFAGYQEDSDLNSRWLPQMLTRGFAAGAAKITLMDLLNDTNAQVAARTYLRLFPDPRPMLRLTSDQSPAQIYRTGSHTWAYVGWATSATTTASFPVRTATARVIDKYGNEQVVPAVNGAVSVELSSASSFNEPKYVVEQGP